jgi:hypothetical protein
MYFPFAFSKHPAGFLFQRYSTINLHLEERVECAFNKKTGVYYYSTVHSTNKIIAAGSSSYHKIRRERIRVALQVLFLD